MPNLWQRMPSNDAHGSLTVWLAMVVAVCSFWSVALLMADEGTGAPTPKKEIRFAATLGLYPNVSHKDGRMALELLMHKTIIKNKYPYSVKLVFIDPVNSLPEAIKNGEYHFVTLSSIDYYKYRSAVYLNPILTPTKIDSPTEQLVLLTGTNQDLATIHQRGERSLILENGTSGDFSKIWLDQLLMERGFDKSDQFFTKIRRVSKPGRAVLPIFFNQADACVVPRHALDVIQELNPQISQKVKPIRQSKGLLRLMICATDQPSQEDIEILIRESTLMEQNPETLQALTILQMKRFVRVLPEDLKNTEQLLIQIQKYSRKNTTQ